MKNFVALIFLSAQIVNAQIPTASTMKACYSGTKEQFFCNPGNSTATNTTAWGTSGWCCAQNSTDLNCINGATNQCSLTQSLMEQPLYMTYWVGMSSKVCGIQELTATDAMQVVNASSLTLGARTFDPVIESCYWTIKTDTNKYHDSAQLYIYLDSSSTASMWVFAGTDRRNASLVIENNGSVPIGAPVRVPIGSGAIVVIQATSGLSTVKAQFSYKVVGTKYNWYEQPFVGKKIVYFYLFLVALALAFTIVICCPGCFLLCCCVCIIRRRRASQLPKDPKAVSVKELMERHKIGQKKKTIVPGKELNDSQKKAGQPSTKPYVRGEETFEPSGAQVQLQPRKSALKSQSTLKNNISDLYQQQPHHEQPHYQQAPTNWRQEASYEQSPKRGRDANLDASGKNLKASFEYDTDYYGGIQDHAGVRQQQSHNRQPYGQEQRGQRQVNQASPDRNRGQTNLQGSPNNEITRKSTQNRR